jgi:hypothetical protein
MAILVSTHCRNCRTFLSTGLPNLSDLCRAAGGASVASTINIDQAKKFTSMLLRAIRKPISRIASRPVSSHPMHVAPSTAILRHEQAVVPVA